MHGIFDGVLHLPQAQGFFAVVLCLGRQNATDTTSLCTAPATKQHFEALGGDQEGLKLCRQVYGRLLVYLDIAAVLLLETADQLTAKYIGGPVETVHGFLALVAAAQLHSGRCSHFQLAALGCFYRLVHARPATMACSCSSVSDEKSKL